MAVLSHQRMFNGLRAPKGKVVVLRGPLHAFQSCRGFISQYLRRPQWGLFGLQPSKHLELMGSRAPTIPPFGASPINVAMSIPLAALSTQY